MNTRYIMFFATSAILSIVPFGFSLSSYLAAQNAVTDARNEYVRVSNTYRSVREVEQSTPAFLEDDDSRGSLTQRISTCLQAAGLSTGLLASLSPQASSQVYSQSGIQVSRRRATLVLTGITLPQLGGFLQVWKSTEKAWSVSSIDLSPSLHKAQDSSVSLPLRVVLSLQSADISTESNS